MLRFFGVAFVVVSLFLLVLLASHGFYEYMHATHSLDVMLAALSSALSIHKLKLGKRKVIDVRVLIYYFCTYFMRVCVGVFYIFVVVVNVEMHHSAQKVNIGKQMNMHSHILVVHSFKKKSHQVASVLLRQLST